MKSTEFFKRGGPVYRLRYVPKTKKWQIHTKKYGAWEGNLQQVWQRMVFHYEMSNTDIRFAIKEMEKKGHNVAEFGIFGGFLFTKPN